MRRLIKYKIYLNRSTTYLSIINGAMIFYVFAKSVGIPERYVPFCALLGLLAMFFVGYLDHKVILEKENEQLYDKTPQIKELLKK